MMNSIAIQGGSPARSKIKKTTRHHATSEVEFDDDELEFLKAVEEFKHRTGKKFPTHCDFLAVLRTLGYQKLRFEDEFSLGISECSLAS